MEYFLTGATGFVGGQVARQLVEAGHRVRAVVRDPGRARDLAELGVSLHAGDVTEKESMRAAMAGADGVFHIAGWYKVGARDTRPATAVNVDGTRNVLALMRELKIARGVYTSSVVVNSNTRGRRVDESYHFDGRHLTEYDRTKAEAHRVAQEFITGGLPLVIVMPGVIYGPGDTSLTGVTLVQYLQRRLPMISARAAFCWAHIEDVARAHLLAMEKGRAGEAYIIAGPAHTVFEVLQTAQSITGIPAPAAAPGWLFGPMAAVMSLLEPLVPLPDLYHPEVLRLLGATYLGDNAKARRELGYAPRPLRDGLAATLQHEMARLGIQPPAAG